MGPTFTKQTRDWPLFLLALTAALWGLALVFSATRYDPALHDLPATQAIALALGAGVCLLLSCLDIEKLLRQLWWLLPGVNAVLLLLLIPLGNDDGTGNKSWIALPGGFNFQPGELVKLSFLLLLAYQLDRLRPRGLNRPGAILALGGHALALCVLVFAVSRDMGMAAVYLAIYFVMLWTAGVSLWWLLAQLGAGLGAAALLWPRLPEYIRLRFQVVLDHDLDPLGKGFQQERSLLAIGSGQLRGQGYLQGTQTQNPSSSALPARHTDFIFSAAGEELGLIGCTALLILLAALVLRCVILARRSEGFLCRCICAGVGGMLGAQAVLNIAMCLYAAPVVGVTLPFFSYGGSSLLSAFGAVGLVLSASRRGAGRKR